MAFIFFRCSPSVYPSIGSTGKDTRVSITTSTISYPLKLLSYLACLFLMFTVAYSRLYLHYHSLDQILVGLFVGGVFGVLWQGIYHYYLTPSSFYKSIATSLICQKFYIKDYSNIPNVLVFEYENIQRQILLDSERKKCDQ